MTTTHKSIGLVLVIVVSIASLPGVHAKACMDISGVDGKTLCNAEKGCIWSPSDATCHDRCQTSDPVHGILRTSTQCKDPFASQYGCFWDNVLYSCVRCENVDETTCKGSTTCAWDATNTKCGPKSSSPTAPTPTTTPTPTPAVNHQTVCLTLTTSSSCGALAGCQWQGQDTTCSDNCKIDYSTGNSRSKLECSEMSGCHWFGDATGCVRCSSLNQTNCGTSLRCAWNATTSMCNRKTTSPTPISTEVESSCRRHTGENDFLQCEYRGPNCAYDILNTDCRNCAYYTTESTCTDSQKNVYGFQSACKWTKSTTSGTTGTCSPARAKAPNATALYPPSCATHKHENDCIIQAGCGWHNNNKCISCSARDVVAREGDGGISRCDDSLGTCKTFEVDDHLAVGRKACVSKKYFEYHAVTTQNSANQRKLLAKAEFDVFVASGTAPDIIDPTKAMHFEHSEANSRDWNKAFRLPHTNEFTCSMLDTNWCGNTMQTLRDLFQNQAYYQQRMMPREGMPNYMSDNLVLATAYLEMIGAKPVGDGIKASLQQFDNYLFSQMSVGDSLTNIDGTPFDSTNVKDPFWRHVTSAWYHIQHRINTEKNTIDAKGPYTDGFPWMKDITKASNVISTKDFITLKQNVLDKAKILQKLASDNSYELGRFLQSHATVAPLCCRQKPIPRHKDPLDGNAFSKFHLHFNTLRAAWGDFRQDAIVPTTTGHVPLTLERTLTSGYFQYADGILKANNKISLKSHRDEYNVGQSLVTGRNILKQIENGNALPRYSTSTDMITIADMLEADAWRGIPGQSGAFKGFRGACVATPTSLLASKAVVGNVSREFVFTMAQRTDAEAVPDARGVECARFCFMTHNRKMVTYAQVVPDPGSQPQTFTCECHSYLCKRNNTRYFQRGYLNRCVARASLPHSPTVNKVTIRRPYAIMMPYSEDNNHGVHPKLKYVLSAYEHTRNTFGSRHAPQSIRQNLTGCNHPYNRSMHGWSPWCNATSFETRFRLLWNVIPEKPDGSFTREKFFGPGYSVLIRALDSSYCSATPSIKTDGQVSTCGEFLKHRPMWGNVLWKRDDTPCTPGVNCTGHQCRLFYEYTKQKQPSCARMKQMYDESSCCKNPAKDAVSRVSPCLPTTLWNEHKQGCEPEPIRDLIRRLRYPSDMWDFIAAGRDTTDLPAISTTEEMPDAFENLTDRSWPQTLNGLA